MNILLERRKRGYSFHQNILDYVPGNISILNSYTSWIPLIKILPLIENNGYTCAQAQVELGMLAGSPCLPLPTLSPHFPCAHSPPWQGHTGIWVHSSWTHAVKDLSLVEFYLSGFWLSVLIVTQITCLFPRVKWPSHTKCTSPSSRRLLPLMKGGSC